MGLIGEASSPLEPLLAPSEYTIVTLTNKLIVQEVPLVTDKRLADLPKVNQLDKELIATVVLEFQDALQASRLALDVPKRFSKFRELLDEPFRSEWDSARNGRPITDAGFARAPKAFVV